MGHRRHRQHRPGAVPARPARGRRRPGGRRSPAATGPRPRPTRPPMASTRGSKATTRLIESPNIDAVYVALPNALHAEPTIRALKAGKAVLCEKPLSVGAAQTKDVLDVAATAARPLWEAFVFPFHAQHQRLKDLLEDGAIGEPAELYSAFHFLLANPANIRMDAALGGGALADVGCYPIRLAFELFGARRPAPTGERRGRARRSPRTGSTPTRPASSPSATGQGPGGGSCSRCGFKRSFDTFTTVLGSNGQIQLTNPFHPNRGRHPDHQKAERGPGNRASHHRQPVLHGRHQAHPRRAAGRGGPGPHRRRVLAARRPRPGRAAATHRDIAASRFNNS